MVHGEYEMAQDKYEMVQVEYEMVYGELKVGTWFIFTFAQTKYLTLSGIMYKKIKWQ